MQRIGSIFVLALAVAAVVARPSDIESKRLIQTSEDGQAQWMSYEQIINLKKSHISFRDITDLSASHKPIKTADESRIPEEVVYQDSVNSVLSHLNGARQEAFLRTFSSYFNRYYRDQTGYDSAHWLLSEIQASIADSKYNGTATAETFEHDRWIQPSIIARLEGADPSLSPEVVVLGAHLDSLNFIQNRPAPGADDNGSGSASLLEALRALLYADFIPQRTVEFQWYAAEEVGLLGSGAIAEEYVATGVDVVSMMNFDVTGYNPSGNPTVGVTTDFVNAKLTDFLRLVIDAYLDYGWDNVSCGYACSDHASFYYNGFISAFPVELEFSPHMHTERDTMETVSMEQVLEFSKLAIGYTIEIAQPHAQ